MRFEADSYISTAARNAPGYVLPINSVLNTVNAEIGLSIAAFRKGNRSVFTLIGNIYRGA